MRTLDVYVTDASSIAESVSELFDARPVAVLVPIEDWVRIDGKESVRCVDMEAELPTIDDLLRNDVLFIHYGEEAERDWTEELWSGAIGDSIIEVRLAE
ncbi:hypothetical protein [Nitratifractor sp.]